MPLPNLIGINGDFGAGKDVIASFLIREFGYVRLDFGDVLKSELKAALESQVVRNDIWDEMPETCRDAMLVCLALGQLDPFLKPTSPEMRRLLQQYGTEFRRALDKNHWCFAVKDEWNALDRPRVVIPSMRFRNEANWGRSEGGVIWKVVRPANYYGYSDRTLAKHASERELDEYPFDRIFDNSGTIVDLERQIALDLRLSNYVPSIPSGQPLEL